jgi:hypothetical protein
MSAAHDTGNPSPPGSGQDDYKKLEPAKVEGTRRALQAGGYVPVSVLTGKKEPSHKGWPNGSPDGELFPARRAALNTGILTGAVLAMDIDCDDPAAAASIAGAARRLFGAAPRRIRPNSPRSLLIYRAANPAMQKRTVGTSGASVEILAKGQQFVAYGLHTSGVPYGWENDAGPHNTPLAKLPIVTEAQIAAFLGEAGAILPAQAKPAPPAQSNMVPLRGAGISPGSDVSLLAGGPPSFLEKLRACAAGTAFPDMAAAAQAGIKNLWFDDLDPNGKRDAVQRCVANMPNDAFPNWDSYKKTAMAIYVAVATLPDGHEFGKAEFLAWSAKNPAHNDAVAERTWQEVCASPPTSLTPGTLLKLGQENGAQLADLKAKCSKTLAVQGPSDLNSLPTFINEADAGAMLNHHLAFVQNYHGKPQIVLFAKDGTHNPISMPDLQMTLAPHFVRVSNSKGGFDSIPAAKWWVHWPGRRVFDRIDFDPEEKYVRPGERVLNTWRGLAIQPRGGRWRLIRYLILYVLCGGDQKAFAYLICWLAHCVQRPGTSPGAMVVLRSDREGMGKSTLGNLMVHMLGTHGFECTSHELIIGQFNESIANRSFVLLEENGFAGDRRQAATLKAIVTAHTIPINPKGKSPYSVRNALHLMQTTNEAWAVPAGVDARRFFVLDVTRKVNKKFFDRLHQQIENGGAEAFLAALLATDLSGFDPRRVYKTGALVAQQMLTADDFTQWAHDCFMDDSIIPNAAGGGWGAGWPNKALHAAYLDWMKRQGKRYPMNAVSFGKALGQLRLTRHKSNGTPIWVIPDPVSFLDAVKKRAGIA